MARLRHILLVGHCGPDAWTLTRVVKRAVPDMSVATVNDEVSLNQRARAGTLLLINRVLDGAFADDRGIELIRRLARQDEAPVMMLISNFQDAQDQAVQAGAQPGFGKDTMRSAVVADRLRAVVDQADQVRSTASDLPTESDEPASPVEPFPPAISFNEPN